MILLICSFLQTGFGFVLGMASAILYQSVILPAIAG